MVKPEPFAPKVDRPVLDASAIDGTTSIDELDELEDEEEFADDAFLEEYRRKRIEELRRAELHPRFGKLMQLLGGSSEFIKEVTNAGNGVWVVCHLSKDNVPQCKILNQCLELLATRYPYTKIVKMLSTDCIPGYPDENLPTILLYRNTKCVKNVVGLGSFGGLSISPDKIVDTLNLLAKDKVFTDDDVLKD